MLAVSLSYRFVAMSFPVEVTLVSTMLSYPTEIIAKAAKTKPSCNKPE